MTTVTELAQPMLGEFAPDLTLEGLDGRPYSLADYRGKLIVIHFGTSW